MAMLNNHRFTILHLEESHSFPGKKVDKKVMLHPRKVLVYP